MSDELLLSGQRICLSLLPSTPNLPLYAAILCGKNLPFDTQTRLFMNLGLIHILVVSGAHLSFVDKWAPKTVPHLRWIVLLAYSYLTGFGAPVVRALVRKGLGEVTKSIVISPIQLEGLTSAIVILMLPSWIGSSSFQMSWMCALALSLPARSRMRSHWRVAIACYAAVLGYCWTSPISIPVNALLVPIVGYWLFPLSMLVFTGIEPLVHFSDWIWNTFIALLNALPTTTQSEFGVSPRWFRTLLPVVANLFLLFLEVLFRKRYAYSS